MSYKKGNSKASSFLSNPNDGQSEDVTTITDDPNIQMALPFLEKRLSNYEHVDIIENNISSIYEDEDNTRDNTTQFREFSNDFEQMDKDTLTQSGGNQYQNRKSTAQIQEQMIENYRISNGDDLNPMRSFQGEYQENNQYGELNEVYTKELKQCDFQLTYMKTEYKKEYLRFEFIPKLNNIIYGKEKNVLLWPNCLQINSNYFIVGGGSGNFIVFSKINYEYEIFNTSGSLKKINCIEMSEDFRVICIGDSVGTLGIYDMKKKKILKYLEGLHGNQAIMSIKIVHNKPNKLNNLQIITSDINGQIKVTYLTKGMFKYSVNQKTLIEKMNYPIQQITLLSEDIKTKYQKDQNNEIRYMSFISVVGIQIYSYSITTLKLELLYQFKNQDFDPQTFSYLDLRYVNLSWGEGYIFEVAEYLYKTITKVICWKNKLYILKVLPNRKQKSTEIPFIFEESNPLVFEKDITHSCFLAQSILFIVDSDQYLYLFNMSDLKKLFTTSMNALELCKENGITPFPLPVKEKFFFQLNKMSGNSAVQTFNQSKYDQEVLFIVDGKMGVGALAKWQSVYNNLIENGEWRQAMHYLTNIYYNKDKFVTNLSSSQSERKLLLEESVKIVANKYLQMCLQIFNTNKDEVTKRNMIGLVVEFLVLTENFEFLFNELKIIVEEHLKCQNVFIECLVPFLRKYKIKYMPITYLSFLIDYFEQRNQISLIEKTMIQLDSTLVNTHQLMEICLKKRLTKALIYICTKGEEGDDIYMTPLSKMWGHYLFQKYQHQVNGKNGSQSQKPLQSEIGDDERIFGERSLWYARICLKRHTITGDIIEDQKYESLVYNLAQWVFNINNLNEILQFSPIQGFEIIHLFFTNTIADIINKKQFSQVNKNEKANRQSRLSVNLSRSTIQQSSSNFHHSNSMITPSGNINGYIEKNNTIIEPRPSNNLNSNFMNNFTENYTVLDEILETIQVCFEQIIESDDPLSTYGLSQHRNSLSDQIFDNRGKSYSDTVNGNMIGQIKQEYYLFIAKLFLEQNSGKHNNFLKSDHVLNLNDSGDDLLRRDGSRTNSGDSTHMLQYMNQNYHLKKGQLFDALIYFIQNPQIINILNTSKEHPTPHITLIEWENQQEVTEIYESQFIQFFFSRLDFGTDQTETLNKLIIQSFGFVELKANIYKDMKEYKKSFDLFITSKNQLLQHRFFNWLNNQLQNQSKEKDHYSSFLQLIEDRLIEIIKINPEKTRELIKKHLSHIETRMIRKMKDFPEKQLEYIQKVIEERDQQSIPKDLLTLYIELLCVLNPSIILQELEKYDYDLDACLTLCKNYNIKDASAHLYEKQGDIQNSFLIHLEFIQQVYEEILAQFDNISEEDKSNVHYEEIEVLQPSLKKMQSEIARMFSLCKKNMSMNGVEECVRLIYSLLDFFVGMLENRSARTQLSEEFYYTYIGEIFIEMQRYVDLDYFIEQLTYKYGHLSLQKLSQTFIKMSSDLEYSMQSYINTNELLLESTNYQCTSLTSALNNGFNGYPVCQVCFQGITNPQLTVSVQDDAAPAPQIVNGWIVQTDNNEKASTSYSEEKTQKNPPKKSKYTILFKCNHYYHEHCYFQLKSQAQSELSDKKSLLMELPLCFICLQQQNNDLYMNLLLYNEQKQKSLKDGLLATVQSRSANTQGIQQRHSFHAVEQMKKPLNPKETKAIQETEVVTRSEKFTKRMEKLQKFEKSLELISEDKKSVQQIIQEF